MRCESLSGSVPIVMTLQSSSRVPGRGVGGVSGFVGYNGAVMPICGVERCKVTYGAGIDCFMRASACVDELRLMGVGVSGWGFCASIGGWGHWMTGANLRLSRQVVLIEGGGAWVSLMG